jgi:hypothetical protein
MLAFLAIAVVLLGSSAILYWLSRDSLSAFVNQDLRKLDDQPQTALASFLGRFMPEQFPGPRKRLNRLLARALPADASTDHPWAAKPWYLWCHERTDGQPGYILFEGCELIMIPGRSSAAVYFLDADGQHLGGSAFSTGWRIDIEDASFKFDPTLAVMVIEVQTAASINGADITCQTYGILGDRIALLRMEYSDGKLAVNNYYNPSHTIGPEVPRLPTEEWESALREGGPARMLEALTWVGGMHRQDPEPPPENLDLEDADSVRRILEVRQRPEVSRAIRRLTQAQHPWIREAAHAALQQFGEDIKGNQIRSGPTK